MNKLIIGRITRISCYQFVKILASILTLGTMPIAAFGQSVTNPAPLKIGIIGSGNIGSTLGTFWATAGHQVLFSSRNPENLKQLVVCL